MSDAASRDGPGPGREPGILVVACGNRMRGDDAFGPAVADALAGEPDLEVVDLGMRPAGLLDHLEGRHTLVIVDAVELPDDRQGRLLTIDWNAPDRPPLLHDDPLSSHGLTLDRQLELARALGRLPTHVILVGVTIASSNAGAAMSPAVRARVTDAAEWVRRRTWLDPPQEEERA